MFRSGLRPIFLYLLVIAFVVLSAGAIQAKPAEINQYDVTERMDEIMRSHATYKCITPEIAKRSLQNFINTLDSSKTYFIESEIQEWISPSDEMLASVIQDYNCSRFPEFEKIYSLMCSAIERRNAFEEQIDIEPLPIGVSPREFKHLDWCSSTEELYVRLQRLKSVQLASIGGVGKLQEMALQRIRKQRLKRQGEIVCQDKRQQGHAFYTFIIKSLATSLDAHTYYFTPVEANQFLSSVQQRLLGIGVQLRDDMDGFTVVKIVEGGPAAQQGELRLNDKIVAIDHEPIVGLDDAEVLEKIRGDEGAKVILTVIRKQETSSSSREETVDITISRGEVVITEMRVGASYEPYADGVIGCLALHSFYQDEQTSSAQDLEKAFQKIAREHNVKALILDLRFNTGGILTQAVDVTGLFIKKGVVVSIKDEIGRVQHLRELNSRMLWDGPLFVLVNRMSASASEIVAQALQDYGRAIIIGDDHTYGKGSFQTFTLCSAMNPRVDPKGEHKVTRGRYYTVSGKTPQLVGVQSDVIVPGGLSFLQIGEQYASYPLTNDSIEPNFEDRLQDVPLLQRQKVRLLYGTDLQQQLVHFKAPLLQVKQNSEQRIVGNKEYQRYLQRMKSLDDGVEDPETVASTGDFQLQETFNVVKDYLWFVNQDASKNYGTVAQEHKAA